MERMIAPQKLKELEIGIFQSLSILPDNANTLADCLTQADLWGISSHGAIRVPIYAKRIKEGLTDISSEPEVIEDHPSSAVINGKNAIGPVAAEKAMHIAVEKAKNTGIACVALGNTNHFGTCGRYSTLALEDNMIGFASVNTTPLIAAFGGTRKAIGNNPFSIAIPASRHFPIILDMACGPAQGKIELLQKQGKRVPDGWAVDADGYPTDDPQKALHGVLLPIAGPKGSGLAISVDILCGILSHAGIGAEIGHLNDSRPQNLGAFFAAIDISKFVSVDRFLERVDGYIDYVKGTGREGENILMPGEISFIEAEKRTKEGIPLPSVLIDELNELAAKSGISTRI